ncbi:S-adenosyl-L-methionine-dependent methyltransferase [Trametes elegans]|nr:S-adenosyl-L-methionine-dependent methyltransferase [Trametes elegans]
MGSRAAPGLLAQLSRAIGRECAQNELRWMRQALEHPPRRIPPTAHALDEMVARRIRGEPLQYILGSQPFGPLHLAVRPPVLIPRPETEDWAIRLARHLHPSPSRPLNILDLGTGTGCIPLLFCHAFPQGSAHSTAVDISQDAIRLAVDNARLCGVELPPDGPLDRDHFPAWNENTFTPILADLMHPAFVRRAGLKPPYDVITSNPPYIPKHQYARLPPSVKDYEDARALLGDGDGPPSALDIPRSERDKGLTFYHRLAELVGQHDLLGPDGVLALEVGEGQARDVAAILDGKTRLRNVDIWRDPWDIERVVVARP